MNPTIQQLMAYVRTREDRDVLQEALTLLKSQAYLTNPVNEEKILESRMSMRNAQLFRVLIESYPKKRRSDMAPMFEELEKSLSQLTLLRMDLAFEPTDEGIEQLSNWVRSRVGEQIILDITMDKSIYAGVRMAFKGRYWESVLAQMVMKVLKQEGDAVLEGLSL